MTSMKMKIMLVVTNCAKNYASPILDGKMMSMKVKYSVC